MQFEQISIEEATIDQLRAYAKQFLGIIVDDLGDAEVLSRVRAANPNDSHVWIVPELEVDQTGAPPPAPAEEDRAAIQGGLGRNDPRVKLTLHAEERDGVIVNRHKEVGVNGVVWLIKRGESVEVPYRVFLALKNAVRDSQTHDDEGNVHHQKVHSVPFNVERMPSQDEIEAWHKRTRNVFCPA